MTHKLTPTHLQRKAIVYVRQSSPSQLLHNRESQMRQYNLANYARELGFTEVETIDEDLGRSVSGLVDRPAAAGPATPGTPAARVSVESLPDWNA